MHLIQLLLPLYSNEGMAFPAELYAWVSQHLSDRFGGLTAYSRSPAEGTWRSADHDVRDDIIVYEVMVELLDAEWWGAYRRNLEAQFTQEKVVIRALPMTLL